MHYWWVNQNQTYRHEIAGGYLWSPKRNANGARNPFYEFMREVSPGDIVLSFADRQIAAIGLVESYCFESPKPTEFGTTGQNWENVGWKVNVRFRELLNRIRPVDHIAILRPLLPTRYSPLQQSGYGLQGIYLTKLPEDLVEVLGRLIGPEFEAIRSTVLPQADNPMQVGDDLDVWERRIEDGVADDRSIAETDRKAIIRARVGQGLFKERVSRIESMCRITKVTNPTRLIASHLKP